MKNSGFIGRRIAYYRKLNGLTQADLAQKIGVSCQAVSKWEQKVCCPDIMLLPNIAKTFDITVDELFGNALQKEITYDLVDNVPWNDDGKLRIAIYSGRKLLDQSTYVCSEGNNIISIHFHGGDKTTNIDGVCKINISK